MLARAKQQFGWGEGALRDLLGNIKSSRSVKPEHPENIIDIPNGLDKLTKAIKRVQREILEYEFERRDIEKAEQAIRTQLQAAYQENHLHITAARTRLHKLQEELIPPVQECGLYVAFPGAEMPEAPPLETVEQPTELEWQDTPETTGRDHR